VYQVLLATCTVVRKNNEVVDSFEKSEALRVKVMTIEKTIFHKKMVCGMRITQNLFVNLEFSKFNCFFMEQMTSRTLKPLELTF
jgi:hypothetical protein